MKTIVATRRYKNNIDKNNKRFKILNLNHIFYFFSLHGSNDIKFFKSFENNSVLEFSDKFWHVDRTMVEQLGWIYICEYGSKEMWIDKEKIKEIEKVSETEYNVFFEKDIKITIEKLSYIFNESEINLIESQMMLYRLSV